MTGNQSDSNECIGGSHKLLLIAFTPHHIYMPCIILLQICKNAIEIGIIIFIVETNNQQLIIQNNLLLVKF